MHTPWQNRLRRVTVVHSKAALLGVAGAHGDAEAHGSPKPRGVVTIADTRGGAGGSKRYLTIGGPGGLSRTAVYAGAVEGGGSDIMSARRVRNFVLALASAHPQHEVTAPTPPPCEEGSPAGTGVRGCKNLTTSFASAGSNASKYLSPRARSAIARLESHTLPRSDGG